MSERCPDGVPEGHEDVLMRERDPRVDPRLEHDVHVEADIAIKGHPPVQALVTPESDVQELIS